MSKDTTNPIRWFDFTIWQSPEKYPDINVTPDVIVGVLDTFVEKYAFQLEECPTTKKLHFQGRGYLGAVNPKTGKDYRLRLKQILDKFPFNVVGPLVVGSSLSATSREGMNFIYVCKEHTRVEGPFTKGVSRKEIDPNYDPDIELIKIAYDNFYPWQKRAHDMVINPPEGYEETMNVIVNKSGNVGKSTWSEYMAINFKNFVHQLIFTPNSDRLIEDAFSYMKEATDESRIEKVHSFLIDMPCATDPKKLSDFYMAIEQIKNGHVVERRYHVARLRFKKPQIWIFTNKEPDRTLLTERRWKLWTVDKNMELVPYKKLTMFINKTPHLRLGGDLPDKVTVSN